MSTEPPRLTVIIPTLADTARREGLLRAIDGLLAQPDVAVRPLIVINGDRFDPELRRALEARDDLDVHYQEEGSLPKAIETGRGLVTTEFFAYLDDDDEYTPGTLYGRVRPLLDSPDLSAVISNGHHRQPDGTLRRTHDDMEPFRAAPLESLSFVKNWLGSCSGIYRTSAVPAHIFTDVPRYLEWTVIAYRLASENISMLFADDEAFIINETEDSLSRSDGYIKMQPEALQAILRLDLPGPVVANIKERYVNALHILSGYYRERRDRRRAWSYHLKSLLNPYGFMRYALYTRRLLF